ncbi:MAG: VPLPA-CTERM sorting domain-containing protein [Gammaproteobacteria bacterium]
MNGTTSLRVGILASCLLLGASAQAAVVSWTINDAEFSDGTELSGTFDFDSVTETFSNVNIVTLAEGAFTGQTYTSGNVISPYNTITFASASGPDTLEIWLDVGPGQFFSIPGVRTINTTNSFEADVPTWSRWRTVAQGTLTGVPIPAAVWLFGSALAGLGWIRRKQAV